MYVPVQNLRERKKAATRQAISDVATRLFVERGFEDVTVAEIADAAGVSVKTVFNYFGSKEELFFDADDALLQTFVARLRERGPGVSATRALRPLLLDGPVPFPDSRWAHLRDGYERFRAWTACESASPALAARRLVITRRWAAALAQETGSAAWAAMFVGILGLRHHLFSTALLEGRTARTVERRVRAGVGEALDALERAFPDGP